jgi:hypothetical protein
MHDIPPIHDRPVVVYAETCSLHSGSWSHAPIVDPYVTSDASEKVYVRVWSKTSQLVMQK